MPLVLRGIEFPRVFQMSGVTNFFGEGYPFHRVWKQVGMDWSGTTFVAKTTTLKAREGNMPRREDGLTPKEWKPRCIIVKPLKGVTLNAVGLSGPGLSALLDDGRWQKRINPFWISFMSTAKNPKDRLQELEDATEMLSVFKRDFIARIGLQVNYSCPNVGLDATKLVDEVQTALTVVARLDIPIMPKFDLRIFPKAIADISTHPTCDAVHLTNALPWGSFPSDINWKKLFGNDSSPLAKYGGGGLSGKPLLPLLIRWLVEARSLIHKPIVAGGGILSPSNAERVITLGADAIALGTIGILRPWRMKETIHTAYKLYREELPCE